MRPQDTCLACGPYPELAWGYCEGCRTVREQVLQALKTRYPGARFTIDFKVRCTAIADNGMPCELEFNHKSKKHYLISKSWEWEDGGGDEDEGSA